MDWTSGRPANEKSATVKHGRCGSLMWRAGVSADSRDLWALARRIGRIHGFGSGQSRTAYQHALKLSKASPAFQYGIEALPDNQSLTTLLEKTRSHLARLRALITQYSGMSVAIEFLGKPKSVTVGM